MARPMPEPAPVTTTTFPSYFMDQNLFFGMWGSMSLRAVIGEGAGRDDVTVPVRPRPSPAHGQRHARSESHIDRRQEYGGQGGGGVHEDFEVDRRVDRNRRQADEPQ